MTYTHQSQMTHVFERFNYHMEDFDCAVCANKRKGNHRCGRSVCEFQDLKDEAVRHNRVKRRRGWFKYQEE